MEAELKHILMVSTVLYLIKRQKKDYRRKLQSYRRSVRVFFITSFILFDLHVLLMIDHFLSHSDETDDSLLYQYRIHFISAMKSAGLKVAYILVVAAFYIIASYVTRDIAFRAVEDYLTQYNSHTVKITYMCLNILTQAVLFSVGYFGVLIILLRLLGCEGTVLVDNGFWFATSGVFTSALKYPLVIEYGHKEFILNSISLFLSLRVIIWILQYLLYS